MFKKSAWLVMGAFIFAACGSDSATQGDPSDGKKDSVADILKKRALSGNFVEAVFSRDDRPVDGLYVAIRIAKDEHGTFEATLSTSFYDRINGKPVDETETLENGLQCGLDEEEIFCFRDDLPVDGPLVELEVKKDDHGTYQATLLTAIYDRINGGMSTDTKVIGEGLRKDSITLEPTLPEPTPQEMVFSRDDRPVDGMLVELRIAKDERGTFEATLTTALYDRIHGQPVSETKTIGSGLECSVDEKENVSCVRDDLPVDGARIQLLVEKNAQGTYNATQHQSIYDRIQGQLVTEKKDLGEGLRWNR